MGFFFNIFDGFGSESLVLEGKALYPIVCVCIYIYLINIWYPGLTKFNIHTTVF